MQCPACAVDVSAEAGNRFCEECGAELSAAPSPSEKCACGAPAEEIDEDGFCLRCGRRSRAALPTDHMEQAPAPRLAGVSDRGLRHDRNEDRMGVFAASSGSAPAGYALVVCDGVSATRSSEIASEAVTEGVLQVLAEALSAGPVADAHALMRAAIAAGCTRLAARTNLETRRTSASRRLDAKVEQAPSTTVVAALVLGRSATIAWIGDSRAYWIGEDETRQLTQDHSWQNEVVTAGRMTAEEAARSPKAHAITRWIGADADNAEPDVITYTLPGNGTLLLCTDGLWNYVPAAKDLGDLVRRTANQAEDVLSTGRALVAFALERGGQDNITVAMLRTGPHEGTGPQG